MLFQGCEDFIPVPDEKHSLHDNLTTFFISVVNLRQAKLSHCFSSLSMPDALNLDRNVMGIKTFLLAFEQ